MHNHHNVNCLVVWGGVFLISLCLLVECKPIAREGEGIHSASKEDRKESFPEISGRYFEGDLAISAELVKTRYTKIMASMATVGNRDRTTLWPKGELIYSLHHSLSRKMIPHIRKAMQWWERATCIKFKPRTTQHTYVQIQSTDPGCYSDFIGYSGTAGNAVEGPQILNLQENGCSSPGTVAHELGHNLGLWHEQSRPDRDNYIRVISENIESDDLINFMKMTVKDVRVFDLPYDFDSVMHYSPRAFSKNGKATIEVVNRRAFLDQGKPMIGQRDHLSKGDAAAINRLYRCREEQLAYIYETS